MAENMQRNKNQTKKHLLFRRLHAPADLFSRDPVSPKRIHTSNNSVNNNNPPRKPTEHEIRQREVIEQYIMSKLELYAMKPRLWQLAQPSRVKQHLLHKSRHIARQHSLRIEFVEESINNIFVGVDKAIEKLRKFLQYKPSGFNFDFEKVKLINSRWKALQLMRAREIFSQSCNEGCTDDEILQKYFKHIIETFTPKRDTADSNCSAQGREQKFDLDHAYNESQRMGKEYLINLLESYRERSTPDLDLIQEMINLGVQHMKSSPKTEDFNKIHAFLSKVSVLRRMKQAYESDLHNIGDDFMLLRFGKVFGSRALPKTARLNTQFIYLVHLFIKSILHLIILMKIEPNDFSVTLSILRTLTKSMFSTEAYTSIIRANDEQLFAPESNVDQWTWLLEKWRDTLRTFPLVLTKVGAFSRLMRTTIGIGVVRLYSCAETIVNDNETIDETLLNKQLFHALQTGFYFGVAYAVVDCMQDEIHNMDDISSQYLLLLRTNKTDDNACSSTLPDILDKWLLTIEEALSGGELHRADIPKTPMTLLLLETFDSLITLTKQINITSTAFNDLSLLLRSQRMDKKKEGIFYEDEELFIGAMLKSHFTYTFTNFMGNVKLTSEESERLWTMPFLGQLTDDCRDFYSDIQSHAVTSFTHYASFSGRRQTSDKHLLNPFFAFLYLCSDLYLSSNRDPQTGAFVGRRIVRTLKSIEMSCGQSGLREFLYLFCQNNLALHDYFWTDVRSYFGHTKDPEKEIFRGIDKASVLYAKTNRKLETYITDHLKDIEDSLEIHSFGKAGKAPSASTINLNEKRLLSGMNYSVQAGGKRLRPLLMMMVADLYNLDLKRILPLACGIEYLHTSSLIFDDLPAQDNSDLRRGRPTLHKAVINNDIPERLCEGRAQLAAVDLIAVSMNLINSDLVRNGFPTERVNQVVGEIAVSMHDLCVGQMMDLHAAHVNIPQEDQQVEDLDHTAWLKTGKALEVVLITPAILSMPISGKAENEANQIENLRELGRLMGILFQMRDDLLDIEGENMGKPTALDVTNNTVTYVSLLGVEGAKKRLKDIQQQTLSLVNRYWSARAGTIKDVINYIVERKN